MTIYIGLEAHPNRFYGFFAVLAVLLAAFLLYSYLWPFPDWMYAEEHVVNLIEARHNASLLTGALAALTIAYTLDIRRTRFDTKAVWWAQILKVVLGLVITLARRQSSVGATPSPPCAISSACSSPPASGR